MRKVLSYILIVFSLFWVLEGVNASEYSCKYAKLDIKVVEPTHPDFGDFTKGTINNNTTISFKVIDRNVKRENVTVENIAGGKEEIVNWNTEKGGFSAQKYVTGEACPPYALALDDVNGQWEYFVFEKSEQALAISNGKKNVVSMIVLKLVEGPTLDSDNTNSNDEVYGPPKPPTSDLFTCSLNGYTIVYNTNGEITQALESGIQNFKSDFNPKNENECPTEKEAKVEINRAAKTFYVKTIETFECYLKDYVIKYNINGKIVLAKKSDGENVTKYLESYFHPKSTSECPTEENAKISVIDGGRTFYVAKIDETFTSQESDSNIETTASSCLDYDDPTDCKASKDYACVWNETKYGDYCNVDNLLYIKCGDAKDIPHQAPPIVSFAINFLKILTPIILIAVSVISLLKALSASNEDEIKKAQKGLIRKVIAAVMVFFIISIVQFVIMKVADNETKSDVNDKTEITNLSDCLNCFLNNKCGNSTYYKTNVAGEYMCTYLNDPNNPKMCDEKLTK